MLVRGWARPFFEHLAVPDRALARETGELKILCKFQRIHRTGILAQTAEHAPRKIVSKRGQYLVLGLWVALAPDEYQFLGAGNGAKVACNAEGLAVVGIDVQAWSTPVALSYLRPLGRILLGARFCSGFADGTSSGDRRRDPEAATYESMSSSRLLCTPPSLPVCVRQVERASARWHGDGLDYPGNFSNSMVTGSPSEPRCEITGGNPCNLIEICGTPAASMSGQVPLCGSGAEKSAVYFTQNDINGPNDGHDIRHQCPFCHGLERLKIQERWWPHPDAIGLGGAIAYDEIAQFAFWRLDRYIDLPDGRLQDLRHPGHDGTRRNAIDCLFDDANRLPHLCHPHHVTVVAVATAAGGDIEVILFVSRVGLRFAQIPFHSGRANQRPGYAESFAVVRGQDADTAQPIHPDAIVG